MSVGTDRLALLAPLSGPGDICADLRRCVDANLACCTSDLPCQNGEQLNLAPGRGPAAVAKPNATGCV